VLGELAEGGGLDLFPREVDQNGTGLYDDVALWVPGRDRAARRRVRPTPAAPDDSRQP
jgi:hypothetical protein